eukprot:g18274.t1
MASRFLLFGTQAGVAINTDATHMLNDFGVKMASTVDLRVLAVSKLVVTSSRTLAGLTACLLERQLPKDTVRCSGWGSPRPSDEQRDYAIRDAVASAFLYEAIHENKDPITSVPSSPFDPAIGLKVRLYNASHSACVAVGHVVSDATAEVALRHWQSSARRQGLSGRRQSVVVKISEGKVPSAFVQHAKSPPSPEGNGSRRCTIGQAAPNIVFPKHSATTGGGERKEVGDESPEVAECGEFEGMVLWDLDHMRDADSYAGCGLLQTSAPPCGGRRRRRVYRQLQPRQSPDGEGGADVIDSVDVSEDDGVEDEEPLDLDSARSRLLG